MVAVGPNKITIFSSSKAGTSGPISIILLIVIANSS
ncbi:PTS sorbitol transporter subunit IIA [Listeria monocytogenes]|nr:PTS sorbitol transporter subunit IIA [Listeria monocytogenes]